LLFNPPKLASSRDVSIDKIVEYARAFSEDSLLPNNPIGGVMIMTKAQVDELKKLFSLEDNSSRSFENIQAISDFVFDCGGVLTFDGVHRVGSCKLLLELFCFKNGLPPFRNAMFDLNDPSSKKLLDIPLYRNTYQTFRAVNSISVIYDREKVNFEDPIFLKSLSMIGAKRNLSANDVQKYGLVHILNQYVRIPLLQSLKAKQITLKGYDFLPTTLQLAVEKSFV
jgi:hypothetical protein